MRKNLIAIVLFLIPFLSNAQTGDFDCQSIEETGPALKIMLKEFYDKN